MVANVHEAIGITAGLVGLAACIPYIPSILRGETKPNRVSWFVWMTLGLVTAVSYQGVGADSTMLLSIWYGVGGWSRLDRLCLAGVVVSAVVWVFSPGLALALAISVDFLGLVPTLHKSWVKPREENLAGWVVTTIAAVINLFAIDVNTVTFGIVAYPFYAALGCAAVMLILRFRQRQIAVS